MPELEGALARRRFERAAPGYRDAAKLEAEVGDRMRDRLDYIKLDPRRVLDAGSGPPQDLLRERYPRAQVVALDFALGMLRARKRKFFERKRPWPVCADFARLPLAAGSVDLVWSNMALHWAAEPAAVLREFQRVLATDGLLMFSTLGPDSLAELRAAAGEERTHRFVDMHDLGDLLLGAGFSAPVMDAERLTFLYEDADALLADLRATGQTCARRDMHRGLSGRRFFDGLRATLNGARRDGKLAVSYEVVYGHAWKGALRKSADGRSIVHFERAARSAP